jgi:hypothetical protein
VGGLRLRKTGMHSLTPDEGAIRAGHPRTRIASTVGAGHARREYTLLKRRKFMMMRRNHVPARPDKRPDSGYVQAIGLHPRIEPGITKKFLQPATGQANFQTHIAVGLQLFGEYRAHLIEPGPLPAG